MNKKLFRKDLFIPITVFIILIGVLVSAWKYFEYQKNQDIALRTELMTNQVASHFEESLITHLEIVKFLRREWMENEINTPLNFKKVILPLIEGFPGFQAINYIDTNGVIHWVYPEESNMKAKDKDLHVHPFAAKTFLLAEKTGNDCITPILDLWQGGLGFAAYFPLIRNGKLEGYLNGVFKLGDFVHYYFKQEIYKHFYFNLKENNHDVHTIGEDVAENLHSITSDYPISILNRNWIISLSPRPELSGEAAYLNIFLFILSVFLSGVFAFIIRINIVKREELNNSEEKYRDLFEKSDDAILIIENGQFVDCNPATVKMLRYTDKNEFLNTHPSELSPATQPDGRASLEKAEEMMALAIEKGTHRFEWSHTKADGEIFPVEVLLTAISSDDDTTIIHTVWRDISGRELSDKLKSVIFQISEATHKTTNIDTLYESIYLNLKQILDVANFYISTYHEKTGLLSFPFLVDKYDSKPDPKPMGNGLTEYVIRTGQSYFLERKDIEKLNQDGKIDLIGTLPRQWLGSPLIADEKVIGVIAIQNYNEFDVYERNDLDVLIYISEQIALAIAHMQSIKELEIEKTYLEELFIESPEAVALVDVDGNVLRINGEFTLLFGYTKEDIIGKNIDTLLTGRDQIDNAKELTRQTQSGRRVFSESFRKKKDGTLVPVSILGSPIHYKDGVLAVYAIYRDITERKKDEDRLKNSEQKHRLLSEQLMESNMMKETLLDVISHDLKNPAGVILGFSELLQDENGDNDIISGIRNSSRNLIKVIDNATTLSKVSLGENIQFESLDLVRIIFDISEEMKPQFSNHDMQLDINLPESLLVQANPIIGEIFKNYLTNAIKYASAGKKVIINTDLNDETITILFNDFGTSIPQEDRETVFERGQQLGNGEKRGRGLGLAIVKRIAEAHHGQVWVEPNEPTGNRFCLRLPLPKEGGKSVHQ